MKTVKFGVQMGRVCDTCAFFSSKEDGFRDRRAVMGSAREPQSDRGGQCRRNPPKLGASPKWVMVENYEWCGEWFPRDGNELPPISFPSYEEDDL